MCKGYNGEGGDLRGEFGPKAFHKHDNYTTILLLTINKYTNSKPKILKSSHGIYRLKVKSSNTQII